MQIYVKIIAKLLCYICVIAITKIRLLLAEFLLFHFKCETE